MSGIIPYWSISNWLISLSIISSIFVVACVRTSVLLGLNIPCIHYICLSIHLSVDTYVVFTLWLLWIMLLWTLEHRQEYGGGLPFPPPGDLPTQGLNSHLVSAALARGFLAAVPPGKPKCFDVCSRLFVTYRPRNGITRQEFYS